MQPQEDLNADKLAQMVVDAGGLNVQAGNSKYLSSDFKALLEKAIVYREAKRVANNRRAHNMLTEQEALEERAARKEFFDAYHAFYRTRE